MEFINFQKVKDGKYLKNYEITYLNKAGREKTYEIVSRRELAGIEDVGGKPSGVSIVATCQGRLLLLHEFRMGVNRKIYNLCAGMINDGETIEECIARELYEETGLSVKQITKILPPSYAAVAISDTTTYIAFAEVEGDLEDHTSDNEEIDAHFYSRQEVAHLLETESFSSRAQMAAFFFTCDAFDAIRNNPRNTLEENVRKDLWDLQDVSYKEFHQSLMPTVDPNLVIGIRMPQMRKYAKTFARTPEAEEYLHLLPHKYYEENNLHALLLESVKDYNKLIPALCEFLPYIDNWATCDLMTPKVFKKHTDELLEMIQQWIVSEHPYTIRFAIEMLMKFYLDESFRPEYLDLVAGVISDEYYVNMMIAWYMATALAKQYESAIIILQKQKLSKWVHNKSIQKALESYRITPNQKNYLRTLKIK